MFGATRGDKTFDIPYGECDASTLAHLSELEPDWVSKERTLSKEEKEPESLEREPCPRGVDPEPSCVERGLCYGFEQQQHSECANTRSQIALCRCTYEESRCQ